MNPQSDAAVDPDTHAVAPDDATRKNVDSLHAVDIQDRDGGAAARPRSPLYGRRSVPQTASQADGAACEGRCIGRHPARSVGTIHKRSPEPAGDDRGDGTTQTGGKEDVVEFPTEVLAAGPSELQPFIQ